MSISSSSVSTSALGIVRFNRCDRIYAGRPTIKFGGGSSIWLRKLSSGSSALGTKLCFYSRRIELPVSISPELIVTDAVIDYAYRLCPHQTMRSMRSRCLAGEWRRQVNGRDQRDYSKAGCAKKVSSLLVPKEPCTALYTRTKRPRTRATSS